MFNWIDNGEDEFGINSQTAEAESIFSGMPGQVGNQGQDQLAQALMASPSGVGTNAVTNPAANMAPGGQGMMPGQVTPQTAPPVTVDEIEMKRAGNFNMPQGGGGGNLAARLGNLAGGLTDAYSSMYGFSFR